MREHIEWNVDTHMRSATGPTSSPTRAFISPAALFVNVMAASPNGDARFSAIRNAMRCVSTRVLPEPAPAMTTMGPSGADAASRWTGLSPARIASEVITPRSYACSGRSGRSDQSPPSTIGVGLELELLGGFRLLAPRAQQASVVGVERHGEGTGGLGLGGGGRLPLAVERDGRGVDTARQPAEAHPLRVEQPRAVGGVDPSHCQASHPTPVTLKVSREVRQPNVNWRLSPCLPCTSRNGRRC